MEGEVRRIHIIYFLSLMGRMEHPHLIRVHHLNRNGVYLRDVKRWMADLRGKAMAEAFAWSYKRRYKNGYVWQDLVDDDLITPICDNEYVLKGSQILPAPLPSGANAKTFIPKNENSDGVEVGIDDKEQERSSKNEAGYTSLDSLAKTSSESCQESPLFSSERSTLTEEDSMKQERVNSEEEEIDKSESSPSMSSNYSNLMSRNKKNKKKKGTENAEESSSLEFSTWYTSPKSQFEKSKSYSSGGASKMLRSLIPCGAVDTNDSALISVDKTSINTIVVNNSGGSRRVFGTYWNQQYQQPYNNARKSFDGAQGSKMHQQQKSRFGVSAAYKPVRAPPCSQCGKTFRPEKLHMHMKSCKGLKASAKNATASVKRKPPPSTSSSNEIVAFS